MKRRRGVLAIGLMGVAAVIAAACGSGGGDEDAADRTAATAAQEQSREQAAADAPDRGAEPDAQTTQADSEEGGGLQHDPATGDVTTNQIGQPEVPQPTDELGPGFLFLPPDADVTESGAPILRGETRAPVARPWQTNWAVRIAEPDEFIAVLPRDAIRSLEEPPFEDLVEGGLWLIDEHPVIQVEVNGDARAFPLGIISKHEVINTTIGGRAVAVTFCPLCNSAIAFERVLDGQVVEFGVSGILRNSDLVMWDRTTETLWQQLTGEALVGAMVGMKLDLLSAPIVSWGQFKEAFPDGLVLSLDTGFAFRYDLNSYLGYDSGGPYTDFFREESDLRLRANERVAAVDINDERVAYSFELLAEEQVLQDTVGGEKIVVVWTPGTVSALDQDSIADSRDVGATGIFRRELDGRVLSFSPNPDDPQTFIDTDTGSVWDIFGRAVAGELEGAQLEVVVHGNHFWFAWAAFFPDTELVRLDT